MRAFPLLVAILVGQLATGAAASTAGADDESSPARTRTPTVGGGTAQAPETGLPAILELVEENRLAEAETALRRLIARRDDPSAHDLLGVVLLRQERVAEAREHFRIAIAGAPGRPEPRQHLARLLLMTGEEDRGLAELRIAAELGALERDLALRLAAAERAAGNAAAAEAQLRSVIDRFDSVRARLHLADLLADRGDPAAAHALLRETLQLAPNSEDVLSAYARLSLTVQAPVPAILSLEPLVRMHPSRARYSYLLGVARMQVGDMEPAATALQTAIELDPDYALAKIALGIALNNQKRFEESVRVLSEALRLQPESVQALAAMAEAELGMSDLAAAERHAARALDREPSHRIANLVMGMIRLRQRDYESARDYLIEAVTADPESPKAHYQLSLAYARLGEMDESREHLERYRSALETMERQLEEIRSRLGIQTGGMQP